MWQEGVVIQADKITLQSTDGKAILAMDKDGKWTAEAKDELTIKSEKGVKIGEAKVEVKASDSSKWEGGSKFEVKTDKLDLASCTKIESSNWKDGN